MKTTYRKVFWSAGFGWLFDAMDVGLLSFLIVQLSSEWGLTPIQKGLLGTFTTAGMAFGAPLGGYLADRVGRRPVFLCTLVLFGLASLGSAFSPGLAVMLLFRLLMGIGLGAELPVASTLVNELSPPEKRGRTVVLLESFWAVGWIAAASSLTSLCLRTAGERPHRRRAARHLRHIHTPRHCRTCPRYSQDGEGSAA